MAALYPAVEEIAPAPSAEEAAAIVAAIARFMRDTLPAPPALLKGQDAWQRAAILEGVTSEDEGPEPWINT
jgi:hypothetical protein